MKFVTGFSLLFVIAYGDHEHHDNGHHHHTSTPPSTSPPAKVDPIDLINRHIASEVHHLWTQMDYNKDGNFGRDDLQHFIHSYDTDRDGEVTRLEFLDHWTKEDSGLSMVGEGIFLEFDFNHDQSVDDADLDGFHNKVDTSKDGTVGKSEFTAYFKQLLTLLYVLSLNPDMGALG